MWYPHINTLAELLLKATALLALAFLSSALLRRAPASLRHALWTATMAGLLLLPIAVVSNLSLHLPAAAQKPLPAIPTAVTIEPTPLPVLLPHPTAAPLPTPLSPAPLAPPTPFPWRLLLTTLWSLGTLLFLARIVVKKNDIALQIRILQAEREKRRQQLAELLATNGSQSPTVTRLQTVIKDMDTTIAQLEATLNGTATPPVTTPAP